MRGLRKAWPGVVEAANLIGSNQIQGRCTMVGNLCNASPAADSVPALVAAGAMARDRGPEGKRNVPVESDRRPVPARPRSPRARSSRPSCCRQRPPRSGDAYLRFIPRTEMDIAVVGAGVSLALDDERHLSRRRASRSAPWRRPCCWSGRRRGPGRHASSTRRRSSKLAAACSAACRPIDDKRGTIEFRTKVAGVLAQACGQIAYERAGGEMMAEVHVSTTVNGDAVEFLCEPRADAARRAARRLGLTGAKEGCDTGDCGACTVIARRPAGLLLPGARRRSRGPQDRDHRGHGAMATSCIRCSSKFLEHAALQCGICTPGFLIAAKALLDQQPRPERGRKSASAGRQSLPLHRLRQDRPRRPGRRQGNERSLSHATR